MESCVGESPEMIANSHRPWMFNTPVPVGSTTSRNAGDVLVTKLVLPGYTAVKLAVPTGNVLVENVATPREFRFPVPIIVEPL